MSMNSLHRHDPPVTTPFLSAGDVVRVAATAYRDALYLYGSSVLTWAELVATHRELRAAIRRRTQ